MTKSSMVNVLFLPNGNTAVFKNGKQVPELQMSWLLKFVEFLEQNGVDIENSTFELPTGNAKLFKTDKGYNWQYQRKEI